MTCRWDNDQHEYTTPDGQPCTTDDYGDPTNHCSARRTCTNHIGPTEQTCARCLGRTRNNIHRITTHTPLLTTAALESRTIHSQATNLAGPACDVEAWSWRKVTAMQGRTWHLSLEEDDDDWHPHTVITRWAWMIACAYQLPEPDVWTVPNAAALLNTQLNRIAQDPEQDFTQMSREIKGCRERLDAALSVRPFTQRGVPCPRCRDAGKIERLVREYPHWCDDENCTKLHVATDEADLWVCPSKPREHWWSHRDYSNRLEERMGA